MKGLNGKRVVITGAAKGLGLAIAQGFAREQSKVVIADIDLSQAQSAAQEIREMGMDCDAYYADVSDIGQIKDFFATLNEKYGKLDVFINNAGIQIRKPSIDFLERDWDRLMNINLKAVFFCGQQAALMMRENGGGVILNMSSGTSTQTTPGKAPYTISKAGINSMTAVLASEWAQYGIRMNAVAPGWIMTDMLREGMRMGVVSEKQIMAAVPAKRYASPEEIADAFVFLASDNATYITGQTLFVDGGWSALGLPESE